MKNFIKIIALALISVMILGALASCGSGKPEEEPEDTQPADTEHADTEGDKEVTGETKEALGYKVLVPEGFELAMAGEFSSYDFSVRKSDFVYFDFNTESDDDLMMQHYNYNKNTYTNEQQDVAATCGANEWTGFQYSDGWGGYGFEAYTTVDGKTVRVSCAGFKFDSAEAEAILASLTK